MQYLNKCLQTLRSKLFKGWIYNAILWIAIYPVNNVISLSNIRGQVNSYHYNERVG